MRSVNVAELQNDLNAYIHAAQAGEEVIIRDHDQPVAKLVPFSEQVDAGTTLPKKRFDPEEFFKLPIGKCKSDGSAVQAILDEREESW